MKLCFSSVSDYGVHSYDIGSGFGHFAIATQDVSVSALFNDILKHNACFIGHPIWISLTLQVYKMVEDIKAKGGTVTREAGPVKGGTTVIAFVKDPDGYIFELIQRGPTPQPLCQVMLRVGDLERSIKFYEKVCFLVLHVDEILLLVQDPRIWIPVKMQ